MGRVIVIAAVLASLLMLALGCGTPEPQETGSPGGQTLSGKGGVVSSKESSSRVTAGPSKDDAPPSDAALSAREAAQAPLVAAANEIQGMAMGRGFANFGGVRLDPDHRTGTVWLHWKGPLPAEMAELVEELREDVRIEVVDAPYSLAELLPEARRIASLNTETEGFDVTSAGPLSDFSGIRVTVTRAEDIPRAREAITSPMKLEFDVMGKPVPLGGNF